jgi:oligopeptidase B
MRKTIFFSWSMMMTLVLALILGAQKQMEAPKAKQIPKTDSTHSDLRVDPYFWLREKTSPDVLNYLNAENAYTQNLMAHTQSIQNKLYQEMISRIKETDFSVPAKMDNYFYYYRTEKGKQYRIYCRKKGNLDSPEEILLDLNELGKNAHYLRLGVFKVSPDHQRLAYSVDTTGGETYTIYVKDLNTQALLTDRIPNTYYSLEWANDNRTFFYNTLDAAYRPYRIFRHALGSDPQTDELIYEEKDERFFVNISKSRSRAYVFLNLESNTTKETRWVAADRPTDAFKIFQPRLDKLEYSVDHWENKFFVVTNDHAVNFKLMETPLDRTSKDNWKEVIPHQENVLIEEVDAFKNFLVVYERKDGLKKILIRDLRNAQDHVIENPESVYTTFAGTNLEYATDILRYDYTSLVTPLSTYDYNMVTKTRELKKQQEVPDYDPRQYTTERVFAKASDGTKIPMSLVYKTGMKKNGNNPALLYGYGSYGLSMDPTFNTARLSLLDRGFVYAVGHIRGGSDMGRSWYDHGKLLEKKNTFTDFIACAEALIKEKYTSKERLAIQGGSAGGLLMGAVTNMRPDLFRAVVANVPFVDVLNTMLDASLPLTVTEYEEWGNPNEKAYYDYMKSYSPYDNVEKKNYPNILITAGLNDPRVSYWEPAKWTAKLRAMRTDNNLLLLKTNMGAGHGGASGRYDRFKEIAFDYAFILDRLGGEE